MANLAIPIEDQLLKALMAKAEDSGVTLEKFAVDALRAAASSNAKSTVILDADLPNKNGFAPYLSMTLQRINALETGVKFTLSGNSKGIARIFAEEEWKTIKVTDNFSPTNFGKFFKSYVEDYNSRHPAAVEILGKTSDNKQIYRKLKPSFTLKQ